MKLKVLVTFYNAIFINKMKHIISITIALFIIVCKGQKAPSAIAYRYEKLPDIEISDEFNASRKNDAFDTSKWHYRKPTSKRTGLATDAYHVKEKEGKLICYGQKGTKKAGAIISNKPKQYGWYSFRWKTTGIDANKRNAWHPAIWGAYHNSKGESVPGTVGKNSNWMEIDIVEFNSWSTTMTEWSADAPAYIWVDSLNQKVKVNSGRGPGFGWKKAIMFDGHSDKYKGEVLGGDNFNEWQVWGMEFHPEYLQMWKKDNDIWVKVGHTIIFTDKDIKPTIRTVPRHTVHPLYWYLGNLYMPQNKKIPIREEQITNSTLEVDWFHFYPLKKSSEK